MLVIKSFLNKYWFLIVTATITIVLLKIYTPAFIFFLAVIPILGLAKDKHELRTLNSLFLSQTKNNGKEFFLQNYITIPVIILILNLIHSFWAIEGWRNLFKIVPIVLLIIFLIFLIIYKIYGGFRDNVKHKRSKYSLLLFMSVLYVFSIIFYLNIFLDTKIPQITTTTILDKNISSGYRSGKTYWFTVQSWISPSETRDMGVSYSEYENGAKGKKIEIDRHPGYFGVPWVSWSFK